MLYFLPYVFLLMLCLKEALCSQKAKMIIKFHQDAAEKSKIYNKIHKEWCFIVLCLFFLLLLCLCAKIPDNKTYRTLLAVILGSPLNKLKVIFVWLGRQCCCCFYPWIENQKKKLHNLKRCFPSNYNFPLLPYSFVLAP